MIDTSDDDTALSSLATEEENREKELKEYHETFRAKFDPREENAKVKEKEEADRKKEFDEALPFTKDKMDKVKQYHKS